MTPYLEPRDVALEARELGGLEPEGARARLAVRDRGRALRQLLLVLELRVDRADRLVQLHLGMGWEGGRRRGGGQEEMDRSSVEEAFR